MIDKTSVPTLSEVELDLLYEIEESNVDLLLMTNHVHFYYCNKNDSIDTAKNIVKKAINTLYKRGLIFLVEHRYIEVAPNYFESDEGKAVVDLDLDRYLEGEEHWKSKVCNEKQPFYYFEPTKEGVHLLDDKDRDSTPSEKQ